MGLACFSLGMKFGFSGIFFEEGIVKEPLSFSYDVVSLKFDSLAMTLKAKQVLPTFGWSKPVLLIPSLKVQIIHIEDCTTLLNMEKEKKPVVCLHGLARSAPALVDLATRSESDRFTEFTGRGKQPP